MCRSLSMTVPKKPDWVEKRETWISLTFNCQDCRNHLGGGSTKHRDLVEETNKWVSLTLIDANVKIIDDDGSRKDRDSFDSREKWISLTFDWQGCPNHLDSKSRKYRYSFGERRELDGTSTDTGRVDVEIDWVKLKVVYFERWISDICRKDEIFNLVKLKYCGIGTNIEAEYWVKCYCNLIDYLAVYSKYEFIYILETIQNEVEKLKTRPRRMEYLSVQKTLEEWWKTVRV